MNCKTCGLQLHEEKKNGEEEQLRARWHATRRQLRTSNRKIEQLVRDLELQRLRSERYYERLQDSRKAERTMKLERDQAITRQMIAEHTIKMLKDEHNRAHSGK